MKTLMIDDMWEVKIKTYHPADRIESTFDGGIAALQEQNWDLLFLDHDLGDPNPEKTGYGIMKWLELHPEHLPAEIVLTTWNPSGRQYMELVHRRLYGVSS